MIIFYFENFVKFNFKAGIFFCGKKKQGNKNNEPL